MKPPRISVVMPAYNSEKYIGEAIESILNQTFTDFELFVLNDSPDNKELENIIKEYAKKDKRVKYMKNPRNLGVTESRNRLLDVCTGEYIACMDSDDISLPTRFEKQIQYMELHPECGVLGTWFRCFGKSDATVRSPERVTVFSILQNRHVGNPTAIIRKSVMDKYGLRYDNAYNWCEDLELWSRMIFLTEIHNLQEVLLRYRWYGGNVSIEHKTKQKQLTQQVQSNILNKLTDDPDIQQMLLHKPGAGIFLPRWLGYICCLFIFNRRTRHNFRDKYVKAKKR